MATPSEQKALAFVAIIALLGGVVRVVRASAPAIPTALEQQAIARQASAAESTAAQARQPRKGARGPRVARPRRGGAQPTVIGGVSSVPAAPAPGVDLAHDGFPPPGPRIDVDYRTNRQAGPSEVSRTPRAPGEAVQLVDLDRASAPEIELLPWVGPALARRIVANRDSFGAFGSLAALARVKGLGPATRKRLAGRVTFSADPSSRR